MSLHAQNPDLDELRKKLKQSPDNLSLILELCESFADFGMSDSCFSYLNRIDDKLLSEEQYFQKSFIACKAHYTVNRYDSALFHCDEMLHQVRNLKLDFSLKKEVLEHIISVASYYVECDHGIRYTESYIEFSRAHNQSAALLKGLIYQLKFYACADSAIDSSAVITEIDSIRNQHDSLQAIYHENWGDNQYYEGKTIKSFEHYLKALEYYRKSNNELGEVRMNDYLADVLMDVRNYARSVDYLLRNEKYVQTNFNPYDLADHYNTLGWAFYRADSFQRAYKSFHRSFSIYRTQLPSNLEIAYPIGNLGLVHRALGNADSAIYYSKKSIPYFIKLDYYDGVAEAQNNIGFTYLDQNKADSALPYFTKAQKNAWDYGDVYEEMRAHKGLYEIERNRNPKSALIHLEEFVRLDKEYHNSEENIASQRLELTFIKEQDEAVIQELEAEQQLKEALLEQQTWKMVAFAVGCVIALIASLMLAGLWMSRKKVVVELEKSNHQNEKIIRMISHDFRGPVGNIKIMLELLMSGDIQRDEFDKYSRIIQQQVSEIAVLFDSFVGWAVKQKGGYKAKLEEFECKEMLDEVVNLNRSVADLKEVEILRKGDENVKIKTDRDAIALILRNVLANAIKFSEPNTSIEINTSLGSKLIRFKVQDSGPGMSEVELNRLMDRMDEKSEADQSHSGIGLMMASDYAKYLGGKVTFSSSPGKGLTVSIEIPLA